MGMLNEEHGIGSGRLPQGDAISDICQSVLGISNAIKFYWAFCPKINQACIVVECV